MPSKEEIESSRIPTSLFLLSTILLGATTRTNLEDKHEEVDGELHEEEGELQGELHGELHREEGQLHGELHGEEGMDDEEKSVKPPLVKAYSAPALLLPGSPAEAPAPELAPELLAPELLAPAPAEAPAPELLAPESELLAPSPAPAPPQQLPRRVTRSITAAAAAGLLPAPGAAPAAAAGLPARRFPPLTPVREGSIESISEERELQELQELLDNLDEKFLNNVEIMKMLVSIDTIIDNEDFSSLDKINVTLHSYGITITPENISINIEQEK